MGKEKKTRGGDKKTKSYSKAVILAITICSLASIFCFQYYKSLHKTLREESKGYLQEVSKRVASNIDRIIQDNFTMLEMMAESVNTTSPKTMDELRTLLTNQQSQGDFETLLLIDEFGKAYNLADNNTPVFFSLDDAVREGILTGERALGTAQIVNNKEYFTFAVALDKAEIEGHKIMALAACYSPESIEKVLSMTSFDDRAYSQIITKSGTIVTKSSSPYTISSGYNVFSTLEKAELDKGTDLADIRSNIQSDLAGQINFTMEGQSRYMVYTPVQPNDWYLLTFVPVQVVNEKSDMLLRVTLLICGLIAVIFCGLIATLFYVFNTNKKRLEELAYVDEVTKGNTIQKFYEEAREALDSSPNAKYALIYSNIENFKVLNTQLGRKNCDMILKHFYTYVASTLSGEETIGRFFADNFCMLMRFTDEAALQQRFEKWAAGAEAYLRNKELNWDLPSTEFGIYVIENKDMLFPEMIDRAKLALKEVPRAVNSKIRYALYDDKARWQLFREKQLGDMMEKALKEGEFQLYLQPKYKLPEERIGGAEALARWQSKSEGMIYPNEFIPLFEKNGFIIQLDLWIFEEVCRTICSWIGRGLPVMKVSVNCSRVHLKNEDFLQPYIKIVDKYGFDRSLIEIELTESVVFENTERLSKIIMEIRENGFGCSMDDFGSGYSSLNLIQSIPVDTLKIDKVFFKKNLLDESRMEAVVGSIVQMAHSLDMITVAEGVEYREQVEMLKDVKCDYIQGFIFDKPMDLESFEKRAFES